MDSAVHKLAGFDRVGWKYDQSAVVATLCLDQVNGSSSSSKRSHRTTFFTIPGILDRVLSAHRLVTILLPGNVSCQQAPLHSSR